MSRIDNENERGGGESVDRFTALAAVGDICQIAGSHAEN